MNNILFGFFILGLDVRLIKEDEEWNNIYQKYSLEEIPWHEDEPDESLIELLREEKIKVGVALDVCSGAGTNTIYLAEKGFDVISIDISEVATKIAKQRAQEAGVSKSCKFYSGYIRQIACPHHQSIDWWHARLTSLASAGTLWCG